MMLHMERAVTNRYSHVNWHWCVVPVAVVFRVQSQALHCRTVLSPVCSSGLSAMSWLPLASISSFPL